MSTNKLSYSEQIHLEIKKAKKKKDAAAVVYYKRALFFSAVISFNSFKRSWAYSEWAKKNMDEITKQEMEFKRFSFLD